MQGQWSVLHPRIGCFYMDFALFLRTAYADDLRVEGTRRNIAYDWMAHVTHILRKSPRAKREDYNWVLDAATSAIAVTTIIRRTRELTSSRIHDLKVTVASLYGHVVRVDGHCKALHRILRTNVEEAAGCILAFMGCGGLLLGELQVYNSEYAEAYLNGARPISQRRFLAGMRPPHIIVDNHLSRGGPH